MSLDDITLAVDYFDLKKIAESGQCFRWKEHGPEWKAAEEAIFQKYNEILDAKISDEPVEVTVTPHKVGDGGILAMPLKANIPDPQRDDWKLVTCPICGAECWENDLARQAMAAEPELRAACTTCALKAGVTAGGKH